MRRRRGLSLEGGDGEGDVTARVRRWRWRKVLRRFKVLKFRVPFPNKFWYNLVFLI